MKDNNMTDNNNTKEDKLMDSEIKRNNEISKTMRVERRTPYYKALIVVIVILVVIGVIWYLIK
jgi:hypothetical protein